jgi:hypothetical protein
MVPLFLWIKFPLPNPQVQPRSLIANYGLATVYFPPATNRSKTEIPARKQAKARVAKQALKQHNSRKRLPSFSF